MGKEPDESGDIIDYYEMPFFVFNNTFLHGVRFGQDLEAAHADAVGKHDTAGSRLNDGLVNGRQQRFNLLVGKLSVNRSQHPPGAAILVP